MSSPLTRIVYVFPTIHQKLAPYFPDRRKSGVRLHWSRTAGIFFAWMLMAWMLIAKVPVFRPRKQLWPESGENPGVGGKSPNSVSMSFLLPGDSGVIPHARSPCGLGSFTPLTGLDVPCRRPIRMFRLIAFGTKSKFRLSVPRVAHR